MSNSNAQTKQSEESKVADKVLAMVKAMEEMDVLRDHITELAKAGKEQHDIEAKILRKAARIIHKGDLEEVEAENAIVSALVASITK